ncbi:MAG: J domain-containing protein [Chloroflexota bacterium]|nr:J domain-containing protein [Chloroflexota bacterium]
MLEADPRHETGKAQERRPNLASSDPYAVLGLTRGASPRHIKRAYFDLVREHSPEDDPEGFKAIRAAYEKLRRADVREETDLFLFQPPYPWEPRGRRGSMDLEVHAEDIWALLQNQGDLGRTDFREDYQPVQV